jgi:hypothetical protein
MGAERKGNAVDKPKKPTREAIRTDIYSVDQNQCLKSKTGFTRTFLSIPTTFNDR